MSYEIYPGSRRAEKQFDKILKKLSLAQKKKLIATLTSSPKSCSKKQNYRCYDNLPNAYRILFEIYDKKRVVMIIMAGDHDTYMTFLKKHA